MFSKVSVIIPVYQAEDYLEASVDSALKQECVGEVILIEDGSTDRSPLLCKKLYRNENRVRFFQHVKKRNLGAGASRNLGIRVARGEFVAFLDADDCYLPKRFENDLQILMRRPDIDGVYSAVENVTEDKTQEEAAEPLSLTTVTRELAPHELFANMAPIGKFGFFHADGLTVRKTIFQKTGFFDVELLRSQDTHMWIKMAAVARLIPGQIKKPVARRKRHPERALRNKAKMMSFRPVMFWKLFQWANAEKIDTTKRVLLWDQYCYYRFLMNPPARAGSGLNALYRLSLHAARYPFLLKSQKYYRRYRQVLALSRQLIRSRTIPLS